MLKMKTMQKIKIIVKFSTVSFLLSNESVILLILYIINITYDIIILYKH